MTAITHLGTLAPSYTQGLRPIRETYPFMALLWLRVALVLYSAAALAVLPAALYDRLGWTRIAIPATVAAALFHFVSLAEMLNAAHHTLPVDSHETQSMLGPHPG